MISVTWLLQTTVGRQIERRICDPGESLHSPHLLDLEVAQVLQRLVNERVVAQRRADEAIEDLKDMRIRRYPHSVLLPRIWQLRHNLTAYDAAYVALAEALQATLITRDTRLGAAARHDVQVEVF